MNNKEKNWRKMIFFFLIFDCFMINLEKNLNINKIREGFYILVPNKKIVFLILNIIKLIYF